MKFIGSLYNYKVIHTDTLFTVLYKLINLDLQCNVEQRYQELDE